MEPSPSIQIESETSLCLENENVDQVDCKSHASDNNEYIPLGDVNIKPFYHDDRTLPYRPYQPVI